MPLKPQDFNIGSEIEIYGRCYKVVDVDHQTRDFLVKGGFTVPTALAYPEVPALTLISPNNAAEVESFSKQKKVDTLKKFLDHDRKVLRFFAEWDNTSVLYGTKRNFTVHFYLADDTVEIRENQEANSGFVSASKLLARMKLPR